MLSTNNTTHIVISGKNWKLSLAELITYLEARNIKFELAEISRTFFVLDAEKTATIAIDDLGGAIKIGDVTACIATQTVKKAFLHRNRQAEEEIKNCVAERLVDGMFENTTGKDVFGVSVYCEENSLRKTTRVMQRLIGSTVKKELATRGKKANFMGFSQSREPQLSHIEVLKKKMVENKSEILFCVGKEQTWIAYTVGVHNPFEFQKRDIGKPNQRKIFAISPRLARIMVNLSSCTEGKVLLDPFCGVGNILQEALLAGAKVVGVDINPWCVEAAKENLDWLTKQYALKKAEYKVLQGDARKLTGKVRQEIDCIVTEPDLGPALRDIPTVPYAQKVIAKIEPLFFDFLKEACRLLKKDGRLIIVTPYIQTRSRKPVTMHIAEKAIELGFKQVRPFKATIQAQVGKSQELLEMTSFVDAEERHKIGREINIFQK